MITLIDTRAVARSTRPVRLKLTETSQDVQSHIQKTVMRQGSVLARSETYWSWLRLLENKLRRTLTLIINMGRISVEEQQGNEDEFAWLEAYKTALLEFNEHKASLAISEAMQAIDRRRRMLRFTAKNSQEWDLLEHATSTLLTIRTYRVLPSADDTQDVAAHDARRAA
jgi:hypothetical protein